MNISIEPEHEDFAANLKSYECCVFCNVETIYWNIESNRPVCPVCSVQYEQIDILNAPYNY